MIFRPHADLIARILVEKFQPKRILLSRNIAFASTKHDHATFMSNNRVFLKTQYFEREALVVAETFRLIHGSQDLHVDQTSNWNSVIWFFGKSVIIGGKLSKVLITREERPLGPYSFRIFEPHRVLLIGKVSAQKLWITMDGSLVREHLSYRYLTPSEHTHSFSTDILYESKISVCR